MAQSVERPTLAQVMISWSVSSSPTSGFVLTAQSLEPASDYVPPLLSLFLSFKNKHEKNTKKKRKGGQGRVFREEEGGEVGY